MSVTLQINTFPDGSRYSEEIGLRPQQQVWWTGQSGTTDVLHEWDTVSTFDSGDLITDNNIAVTTPNIGVPPSDLGGDKSWFYRVTVTDHGDETDEVQRVLHDHGAGTFTLSFDGQGPTGAIDFDAIASEVKTALELLSNITTVSVVESATGDWLVTFEDPGDEDLVMMTGDDGNLTGGTFLTITEDTKGSGAGIDVQPGSGGNEMIMFPSLDMARYHHILVNVIPDFVIGGTDDPIEVFRHLFLLASIIPDFIIGGVDDGINVFRHLYLDANITTLQPCPFFDTMEPTLVNTGEAVLITGDSFGALQSTYDTEVRLYADGPALSGSFITLVAASWSDSVISATVPGGATSGWVTLVQTNGSETCPSSGFKLLQVIQTPPDPDAGWFLLTADKENDLTQEKTFLPGNTSSTSFKKIMNDIGSGKITLPLGDPQIADFINPDTREGVLVRTYLDDRFRYGWFTEKLSHDYDEEGNATAVITGRGMEVVADWAKVKPHDFPASPTKNPTWIYGSTTNLIRNGSMEDGIPILSNPGGEDGNDDEGNLEGWGKRGKNLVSRVAIQDPGGALTGNWYIEFEASDNHSGIEQSIACTPNTVIHVRTMVQDVGATGMRVTLALGGADDIAALGTTYPNNFAYKGEILAELDNVARNPAKNGLPGGSTDGTWQVMDVEVKTGDEQTSLTIAIQNDHHGSGLFFPIRVDDVTIEGWGLGLDDWTAFQPGNHASSSFRLDADVTFEGSERSLRFNPLVKFAGIQQVVQVNPLTKYTATIWAQTFGALGDDTWKLVMRKNDGTDPGEQVGIADSRVLVPGWQQFQVIFTTDAITEELIFRFAYTGPNNPGPIYVDSAAMVPGEPPSTAGKIVNDILDKMALDNVLTYMLRSFTDDLDSKGAAWPAPLSLDIEPEESLAGLLGRLVALGHEWEIVPVDFAEGGDGGFELNLFTGRPFNPQSGIGTNYTTDPEGPVIHPGDATIGGRVIKTAFNTNRIMAIGDDGNWSRVQQHPWLDGDMDPGDPSDHGYLDSFGPIEDVISVPAGDATTVAQFAQARLIEEKDKEKQLQLDMQRSSVIRPFLTFLVGDSVYADMPPYHADPDKEDPKRVRALTFDGAGEGSEINFTVDLNRVVYEDELAWHALIAQLNERAPAENSGAGTGRSSSGGSGGVTQVVEGATGVVVPLHSHDLKSTDIKNKSLSGDVSGTLPGPVTVNAIKGNAVEGDIPVDVGGDPVLMIYDRDRNAWAGIETNLAGAGGLPMTTKGDLHTFTTVDAPLGIGTDGFVLMADAVETTGLKWVKLLEADIDDLTHLDTGAIHKATASEISAITDKASPVSGDFILIEDSEAGNVKKSVTIGNLPGGGGGPDVLTTKGDLHTFDSDDQRLAIGTDTHVLTADAAEDTGMKWAPGGGGGDPLTTKGDVFGFDTDAARIPVGVNDQVLTADSAAALGVKWADATGGGGSGGGITTTKQFDFLHSSKVSPDTLDDEFESTTLDAKWTVLSGSVGTVDPLSRTNQEIYDLTTRQGWLLMQVGSDGSQEVSMYQVLTLADGESVVLAVAPAWNVGQINTLDINHLQVVLSLNTSTTTPVDTVSTALLFAAEADADSLDIQAQAFTSGGAPRADSTQRMRTNKGVFFVRIFRDGTDYHMFYSADGSTWQSLMGAETGAVGTELTHLWISVRNVATTSMEPVPITAFKWIRQGGSGLDPWDPNVDLVIDVGSSSGHVIQDEGVDLAARNDLNFVGLGVTVTDELTSESDYDVLALALGPFLHWVMDDAAGVMTDTSGNNNDGTVNGNPIYEENESGVAASPLSLLFDGTDDDVTIGYESTLRNNTSVIMWYKGTDNFTSLFSLGKSSGDKAWDVIIDASGFPQIRNTPSYTATTQTSKVVDDDVWHMIALTIPSSGLNRLYVDGVEVTTQTLTSPVGNPAFTLGEVRPSTFFNLTGHLNFCTIYNYELAGSDISDLYDARLIEGSERATVVSIPGGLALLHQEVVGSGGVANIEIAIPSNVIGLRIVGNARSERADLLDRLRIFLGTGGTIDDSGTNYTIFADDGVVSEENIADDGVPIGRFSLPGDNELANVFGSFKAEVQGLQDAVWKSVQAESGYADASARHGVSWGQWENTAVCDIIRIVFDNADIKEGSRIAIYGYTM